MRHIVLLFLSMAFTIQVFGQGNRMPQSVSPSEVSNNAEGFLCYRGIPFTGKVLGTNESRAQGYLLVKNGIITNLVLCHDNGRTAINIKLGVDENSTHTTFWNKDGSYTTKDAFLERYPSFRNITDWNLLKRIR